MGTCIIRNTGEKSTGVLEHHTEALQDHPIKSRSRRKYVFTNQIDGLIRAIYLDRPGAKTRPGIRVLAKKVGIPRWALKKRACELGLARTKEKPWSEPELEILARYAWMSDERIRLKLKAAGYSRIGRDQSPGTQHGRIWTTFVRRDPGVAASRGPRMPRGIETRTLRAAIQGGCSRMN
jgi:hypothetical protein